MASATVSASSTALPHYACRANKRPGSQTASGRRNSTVGAERVTFQAYLDKQNSLSAIAAQREQLKLNASHDEENEQRTSALYNNAWATAPSHQQLLLLTDEQTVSTKVGKHNQPAQHRRRRRHKQQQQNSKIAAWFVLVYRWVMWLIVTYYPEAEKVAEDADSDDEDMSRTRYLPVSIDNLVSKTRFSTDEVRYMYRGFKNDCPSGVVDRDTFKDIYCSFFPQGDASSYADLVFMSLDQSSTDELTFEQFIIGLSTMARGTQLEKLEWIYMLYDSEKNGHVTRANFVAVARAMFNMMGANVLPPIWRNDATEQADQAFDRMDTNRDGLVSKSEFISACVQSENVMESLFNLDTLIKTS